ncbi:MAG: DNA-binding protein WhiA [Flavonifractor sp.]|nr:DNA-binding protein WhiA [Flavonifractor sp.]MCI9425379.1 DNA-binding protein WhiA [Flavonifractor sp.]
MSFSSQAKTELCRAPISRRCCARAEAYGILLYCNQFTGSQVRIVTESSDFAARLPNLFQKAFKITFDTLPEDGAGKYTFSIRDADKLRTLWNAFDCAPEETLAHHINFAMVEEDHCRTALFRGAFLAGGSVTDPAKRYHLEISTHHLSVSRELRTLLLEAGFSPKETQRKGVSVTYFKQSEAIEDFLTALGAPLAAMELMNAKAEKDLRGSVNRRVNCDAANLDKTVEAAQEQMEAIYRLEERGLLEDLPDKLKEAVDLRMAHPELTLSQLCQLCDPPVSKSAFNHRLRKLLALSKS